MHNNQLSMYPTVLLSVEDVEGDKFCWKNVTRDFNVVTQSLKLEKKQNSL